MGRVAGLFVYPVKGCRGITLEHAVLETRGLRHDRRWMIASPQGRFLSQRELPALATIETRIDGEALHLVVGGRHLALPLDDRGEAVEVQIWRDGASARRPDRAADVLLSACLGREVMLVRFPDATRRACDPAFAAEAETGFADGFPLLVTSTASLDEVNEAILERGGSPVPMTRFRPNLVIEGVAARTEDLSSRLDLAGGVGLRLVKPCARCIVTTTDQATGERGSGEPIDSLRRIRRDPSSGEVLFGQNAVPEPESATCIAVGEAVRLRRAAL